MYDLQTIIAQNNQAAINAMMAGEAVDNAQAPQPEAWPLTWLADRLKVGPPVLSEICNGLVDFGMMERFLKLIRQFLPEHEAEILAEPRNKRAYRFCYLFGKRYFPLPIVATNVGLNDLVSKMPVELLAMSYGAYHDLDLRQGYLLLLSLVIYPYEGDERDEQDDDVPFDPFDPMKRVNMEAKFEQIAHGKDKKSKWRPKASDIAWVKHLMGQLEYGGKWVAPMGFIFIKIDDRNIELRQAENTPEVRETVRRTALIAEKIGLKVKAKVGKTAEEKHTNGARVPILDLTARLVGEELARRIPADGWTPEELHRATDGTKYDGVGLFADWACSQTGCVMLDNNYGDIDWPAESLEPWFAWSRGNVELLAEDWPKVKAIRRQIDHIVEWVEADPPVRFRELLEFVLSKVKVKKTSGKQRKKGRIAIMSERHAYDPTEHFCPLDQVYDEEEEQDGNEGFTEVEVTEITPADFVAGIIPRGQEHRLRRATAEDLEEATQF